MEHFITGLLAGILLAIALLTRSEVRAEKVKRIAH